MSHVEAIDGLLTRRRELAAGAGRDPQAARCLAELRAFQALRLAASYADLRRDPRCAPAVEFFLSDLYGPQDFGARDRDLERAWRYLRRALPAAALAVLAAAIELQVLTAELDQAVAARLDVPIDAARYAAAYRAVGARDARARQIELVLGIGAQLERVVRHPWIGLALRVAHAPAHAAGLGALQDFLERGYAAFRAMGDAGPLLDAIRARETQLMQALLAGRAPAELPRAAGGDAA